MKVSRGWTGKVNAAFLALFMAVITAFSAGTVSCAAAKEMPGGFVFDASLYAARNPDVAAVFGGDETLLYYHYLTAGIREGRLPYIGADTDALALRADEAAVLAAALGQQNAAELAAAAAANPVTVTEQAGVPQAVPGIPAFPQVIPATAALVDPARPMVALTFDDGPGLYESRILASLAAVGGRATFFLVGQRVGSYPQQVLNILASGSELGNHSYSHGDMSRMSAEDVINTVLATNAAIIAVAGVPATVVRPPYGALSDTADAALGAMGYAPVLWDIDTLDWKTQNTASTVNSVLSHVRDGDIVLMHSIYGATAAAAEQIIPVLSAAGYQLVTVSEMAALRGGMIPGQRVYSFRP